jgi:predicted phage terminase large subunit-like protein
MVKKVTLVPGKLRKRRVFTDAELEKARENFSPDMKARGRKKGAWGSGANPPEREAKIAARREENKAKADAKRKADRMVGHSKALAARRANDLARLRAKVAEAAPEEKPAAEARLAVIEAGKGWSAARSAEKRARRVTKAAKAAAPLSDVAPPTTDQLHGAKLLLAARKARENFLDFIKFMMPDPDKLDDPFATRYVVKPHHRLIAEIMQEVEAGKRLRQAFSIGPQHGKSEPISRMFPAWYMGRNPYRNYMFGTYSQDFADDFGGQVRAVMQSERYKMVFPTVELRKDSKAKDHMTTTEGGQLSFVGRGGAGSGKPADCFIIDDPIKDDQEAQSPTIRETTYQWFTKVAYTRCHALSAIVIVHTRWNEDDLIGRLIDSEHPHHDKDIAAPWNSVNLPAVLKPGPLSAALGVECKPSTNPKVVKAFGDGPIASLWEERFSLEHLASAYMLNKSGFTALYMGRPTPEDGEFFKRDDFKPYRYNELPKNLRMYGASDHALTTKQRNDASVLGCAGVDEHGEIWIMPDVVWHREETDKTVAAMVDQMKRHKPVLWFAEGDAIKKAIGPFLRQRMRAEGVYTTNVISLPISGDKSSRARSIQGMCRLGMVHVPAFASWWPDALQELLRFPNGTHDDVCDFFAWLGAGLDYEHRAPSAAADNKPEFKSGTLAWIKKSADAVRRRGDMAAKSAGW